MIEINPEELLSYVKELEGKTIVVEGPKDSKALKSLGVKNIISLNGRPLAEFAFHVSKSSISVDSKHTQKSKQKKEVVILTDFDSEGRRLAAKLNYLLGKYRVLVNSRLRGKLMKFGKSKIEDFREGDIHGEISANFDKICDNGPNKGQRCSRKT
jgi:5S rRNA maturation endonuclease (ribonuclease M5)